MNVNKYFEKIKKIFNLQDRKKAIENCVIIIIVGVVVIIAGGVFLKEDSKSKPITKKIEKDSIPAFKIKESSNCEDVEIKTKKILSQISNVGEIDVAITYFSTKEIVHLNEFRKSTNETNEKDSGGGVSDKKEDSYEQKVVFQDSEGGGKKPIVVKEVLPEVKGVIVVADGATDVNIREQLSKAVQVLLNVPAHRVQIYQRKR